MGLSGPKKRRKIGHDPNNTTWANSTTGFGQKILSAHGWTPGSYLGAKDAAHARHYSAANASHIRVLLKDDTLGLGATKAKADGHNFGLGGFQDLLGRLNGKSEVVLEKEKAARAEIGRVMYAEQKWGPTRFVRGGYLVGDKIEKEESSSTTVKGFEEVATGSADTDLARAEAAENDGIGPRNRTKLKPGKKTRHQQETVLEQGETESRSNCSSDEPEDKSERRKRKLERRAKREEKRLKRQAQEGTEETSRGNQMSPETDLTVPQTRQQDESAMQTIAIPPIVSYGVSRLAVRQRFIKSKRMAMDPQALREILMLKS